MRLQSADLVINEALERIFASAFSSKESISCESEYVEFRMMIFSHLGTRHDINVEGSTSQAVNVACGRRYFTLTIGIVD